MKDGRVVSGKPLKTEVERVRFPEPIALQKTYAVAHEEGVSLGIYPPFVEKGLHDSLTLVQAGIPPAITARLLATGKISERGVMMPEALDPEELMASFSHEGLPTFVEKRELERI